MATPKRGPLKVDLTGKDGTRKMDADHCPMANKISKKPAVWNCPRCARPVVLPPTARNGAHVECSCGVTGQVGSTRVQDRPEHIPRSTRQAVSQCGFRGQNVDRISLGSCGGCRGIDVFECRLYDISVPVTSWTDVHGRPYPGSTGRDCLSCVQAGENREAVPVQEGHPAVRRIVMNCNPHGFGDAIIAAWIAEGAKASSRFDVSLYAHGTKQELLELFCQTVTTRWQGTVDPGRAYSAELNLRGTVRRVDQRGQFFGITTAPARPKASIPEPAVRWARGFDAPILLFPNTDYLSREWPPVYWLELQRELNRFWPTWFVLGKRDERYRAVWGRYIERQSWPKVCALMEQAKLCIGNDSGPVHVAGTLNTPTLALMGPTNESVFSHMPSVLCLTADPHEIECTQCYFATGPRRFRPACDETGCVALSHIRPRQVAREAARIVGGKGPGTALKSVLSRMGVEVTEDCECLDHAMRMDMWGRVRCLDRLDEITGWICQEAKRRGIPTIETVVKQFIKVAIMGCD